MRHHKPNIGWITLRVSSDEHGTHYRIFGLWSNGEWRLSSGADSVETIEQITESSISWPQSSSIYELDLNLEGNIPVSDKVLLDKIITSAPPHYCVEVVTLQELEI
ncbi:conserved hypothetical protein [Vibrio chagasii]|nr:conserved hypothetical protein [Vibrio chagasii]CAH7330977.1 conserved hypothetical protein [Vibrio chagasii]